MEEQKTIMIKDSFSELGAIQKAFTPEQVKFVIEAVAPGLNEKEVWLFLLKANVLKLNPLLGEIFAYVSTAQGQRKLVVIEGRNGKRNLAAKSGKIESIRTEAIYVKKIGVKTGEISPDNKPVYEQQPVKVQPWEGGELWGATCSIKIKGKDELITETVKFSEYNTGFSVWKSKPETMIKKVAESQALSAALPEVMIDLIGEAENYVTDQPKVTALLEDGNKPATEQQLATLKAIKHDFKESPIQTKQDAANAIESFYNKKGGKKS